MERTLKAWLVVGMLLGTMAYAIAEDITLTTYYPSPRGVYNELRSNSTTSLAVQGGTVTIGTAGGTTANLDVSGNAIIRGNAALTGTTTIQGGSPAVGKVLTSDGVGGATWQEVVYGN